MPPRSRNTSSNASPSTSPSSAGLTKRQRQALRINRAPASASPRSNPSSLPVGLSVSPRSEISSSPPESDLPSTGTSPASVPTEGIRIRRVLDLDESERASPSMYPTPLPDEVEELATPMDTEEADLSPVLEREEMGGVFEVADLEPEAPLVGSAPGLMEEEDEDEASTQRAEEPLVDVAPVQAEVPVGDLIDVQEEEAQQAEQVVPHVEPVPHPSRREPQRAQERDEPPRRPKEMSAIASPTRPPEKRVDAAVAATLTTQRRAPSASPSPTRTQARDLSQSPQTVHGRAHLRAPEAPRVTHTPLPPRSGARAISALSQTLRSATQAVASTATAYAHAYATSYPTAHGTGTPHAESAVVRREPYSESVVRTEGYVRRDGGEDAEEETILGARWDDVVGGDWTTSMTRRLLTLTYTAGVQVWDASRLGQVEEVVNLRIPARVAPTRSRSSVDTLRAVEGVAGVVREHGERGEHAGGGEEKEKKNGDGEGEHGMHGPVLGAGVLPPVSGKEKGEGVELGILTPHALYVYNLGTGHVSAHAAFPPPTTGKERERERGYGERDVEGELEEGRMGTPGAFEATERVVVVTTHSPPALVVLARPCLRILHVFPAAVLAVPHPPSISDVGAGIRTSTSTPFPLYASSPSSASIRTPTLSPTSPTSPPASHTPRALRAPTPISAVHGRLLAFLAPAPSNSPTIGLLSGISSMSGASAGAGAAAATWGRTLGRFFSRSAPAASALLLGGSPPSGAGSLAGGGSVGGAVGSIMGVGNGGAGGGGGVGAWVRVVDLGPLLGVGSSTKAGRGREAAAPRDVHVFEAGRAPLGGLFFASDGTRLFAVRRDGLGAGVWALRPSPLPLSLRPPHLANPNASANDSALPAPRHVYALRRGRTGAVVEAVSGARDGRFVALATRRRTVHVFAVNPYGGRADVRSHLRARVSDAEGAGAGVAATAGVGEAEAEGPTEVNALVRIRLPHQQQQLAEGEPARPPPAPLAIVFVPASGAGSSSASALRSPTSPASPTASGVQDVLVFDPADGVLSLRRITLSALDAPHNGISVSLPAAVGRLSMSASPPASYVRGGAVAAARGGGEVPPTELGGREAVVATWSLRRKRGWAEIRRAEGGEAAAVTKQGKEDWLAQAELSTFTSAPHVLPRAIYLSHQFAFYTLGEDYHALIRRYQFAIGGAKIDVRREVEVSAFAFGPGADEAFVEGYGSSSSPRAIRRRSRAASSSFDEPLLASALAGTHYRDARPPPVLPMLPNGSPASSLTFRSSMPVRAVTGLGDNVAEGLGRLRREMRHQRQKQLVRSPSARKSVGRGDDVEASVPLEFDEEDEDFAAPGVGDEEEVFLRVHADREDDDALSTTSRNGGESVASISTPATSAHPLEDEQRMEQLDLDVDTTTEGEWAGWGAEDKQAVEEAERFDDISVVGFLDEEQAAMQAEAARRKGTTTATARTRTKKRRN